MWASSRAQPSGAEAGVGPGQQVGHDLFVNGALVLEQPQDLVPKEFFEDLRVRRNAYGDEGPVSRKQAPGDQQVDMGMPVQEIPIALDTSHGPRHGAPRVGGDLEKILERFICRTGELGEPPASPEVRP
jgi:hypothetical protein